MNIYLDIETLPSESDEIREQIAATIKPPGNLKKAETIVSWNLDEKPLAIEEAVKKTSFDGTYGRILAVGFAIDDADPVCEIDADELHLLQLAFGAIASACSRDQRGYEVEGEAVIVGHNVSGFDLRFLWQRAVINGLKLPKSLKVAAKSKPWDKTIGDTMQMWNPDRERRISLDKLCKALGVPTSKGELDGSKVYEFYKAGRLEEIRAYCKADVVAVRECYRKLVAV